MTEHICMICFQPVSEHDDPGYFPARCCAGCPCGETQPEYCATCGYAIDPLVTHECPPGFLVEVTTDVRADDPNVDLIGFEFDTESGRYRVVATAEWNAAYVVVRRTTGSGYESVRPVGTVRRSKVLAETA